MDYRKTMTVSGLSRLWSSDASRFNDEGEMVHAMSGESWMFLIFLSIAMLAYSDLVAWRI